MGNSLILFESLAFPSKRMPDVNLVIERYIGYTTIRLSGGNRDHNNHTTFPSHQFVAKYLGTIASRDVCIASRPSSRGTKRTKCTMLTMLLESGGSWSDPMSPTNLVVQLGRLRYCTVTNRGAMPGNPKQELHSPVLAKILLGWRTEVQILLSLAAAAPAAVRREHGETCIEEAPSRRPMGGRS